MKQARLYGPEDLRLDDVPRPEVGPKDVLIKIAAVGICGSDLHFLTDGGFGRPTDRPVPIGHEFAGTIAELGAEVKALQLGQRVVVNPMSHGNRIGTGADEGGFAEYALVRHAALGDSIFPIPDSLSFERACLTEPIAVGMHGLNLAEAQAGCRAVVFGAGPIGLGAVAALAHRGAAAIAVVDIVPERLQRALELGATAVVNTRDTDLRSGLMQALGGLPINPLGPEPVLNADVFIDAAGVGVLMSTAVEMAKPHARLVVIARHTKPAPIDLRHMMVKELSLRGSLCYPTEFAEVLELLNSTRSLEAFVSHRYTLDELSEAFVQARDPASAAKVIVRVE